MRANRVWLTFALAAVAIASVHSCKKQDELNGTAFLVGVTLSGVSADQLRYTGIDTATDAGVFGPAVRPENPGTVPSTSTERVLLKDGLAGHEVDVFVEALQQENVVGSGHAKHLVDLGHEVRVDVTITPPQSCDGCFNNSGLCITTLNASACGPKGGACATCSGSTDTCGDGGVCLCGSLPACTTPGLERCDQGQCKSPCPTCFSNGACVGTTGITGCGINGVVCQDCNPNGSTQANVCDTVGQCRCGSGPPCTPFVGGNHCDPNVNGGTCMCGSQPACGNGMECINNACVCTAQSCPNGCCIGNTCVTGDTMAACGRGGGACLDCGATNCDAGVCDTALCNATNCPNGCCSGASCLPSNSDAGCGTNGAACTLCGSNEVCFGGACISSCNPSNCANGCCDRNGQCQAGTDPTACGTGAAACANCGTNACTGGVCTGGGCGPGNCGGCCDGGTCVTTASMSACGTGGNACVDCGTNPCANGACVTCSAANCDGGCCSNGVCQAGTTPNACGTGGAACQSCGAAGNCDAGVCVAMCTAATCDGGCCDSSGVCQPHSLTNCGTTCMACTAGAANNCGPNGCRCGSQSQCSVGNTCGSDGGCACDPSTCTGCCNPMTGLCTTPGTNNQACGLMGVTCAKCTGGTHCNDGGVCQ